MIRTFRKAALLKIVSWLVLSPPFATASCNSRAPVVGCTHDIFRTNPTAAFRL